jgi:exo-beta-1,3-glucanase (GH17 family)
MQQLYIPLVLALAAMAVVLAGCSENNHGTSSNSGSSADSSRATTSAPTNTELAAYAASRHFPANAQGRNDLHTAAIVNRGGGVIRLYNFDSAPLRNVDVWVNQSFVQRVGAVPANGSVEVRFGDLYNAVGRNLASQMEPIRQVQLVSEGSVYNAWGPASE